jgi:TIR domain
VGGIFICYRREDGHAAGRLYDSLKQRFSSDQIFLDVDNIEPGQTFASAIHERVAASDAMLVVIGPDWLNASDSKGQRRLDDASDFVRLEIEAALKREIRVIPILLEPAELPQAEALPSTIKPLTERQAVKFHHESFSRDAEYLNAALAKVVASRKPPYSQWIAKLSKRSWGYFCIELSLLDEHHRLEFKNRGWFDNVLLDGAAIFREISFPGSLQFQVGSHPNQFELKCDASNVFSGPKGIELLIDNRVIVSAK